MDRRTLLLQAASLGISLPLFAKAALADSMDEAKEYIIKYTARQNTWDGPTTGPKALKQKSVVVVANDLSNSGVSETASAAMEASKIVGWNSRVLDGAGSTSGRMEALDQAVTLKPDGILIIGIDPVEQKTGLLRARQAGIKMASWNSLPLPGPIKDVGISANVTTDPVGLPKAAALWAYVDAGGKPSVVILTDSNYQFAVFKSKVMKNLIEKLGGTVLSYEDMPIAEASNRMGQLTLSLLERYGSKWTHSLAINDIYFDFMAPSLATAGIAGDGKPRSVAAGDGSKSAYQRIRTEQYQSVTVAAPLRLQGWQLVDELNRSFAGKNWSGYVAPFHIVTKDNIAFDGGPQNGFDPDNGYRDKYKTIWGVG